MIQSQSQESKADFLRRTRIRLFCRDDLFDIRQLFEISFPIIYTDSFFESFGDQFFKGEKMITYVAEFLDGDDPRIIGFISTQKQILNESDPSLPVVLEKCQFDHLIYIQNIAIHPEYKRYGLGSYLLRTCISLGESSEKCAGIFLHAQTSNHGNVQFYEKNGFKKLHYEDNYYFVNEKWEDAFLFIYSLHGATILFPSKDLSPLFLGIVVITLGMAGWLYYSGWSH